MAEVSLAELLEHYYQVLDGNELAHEYHERHGTQSQLILTVTEDERAALVKEYLSERVRGKTVVEIGAGIGLLACHLSEVASHVYAIEVDPAWTSTYLTCLYAAKPKNLTWIFGAAEEMVGQLRADVALFCTHSGHAAMHKVASNLASDVIDVHAELVGIHEEVPMPAEQAWEGRR